jgi:hypothetical protein
MSKIQVTKVVLKRIILPLGTWSLACFSTYAFLVAESGLEAKALLAIAAWTLTGRAIYLAIQEVALDIEDLRTTGENDRYDLINDCI